MTKRHLSPKYERALQFAIRAHAGQYRKASRVPYISHPLAVSSLVLEYGGNETQAIAALLHDVIEDCGVKPTRLKELFGQRVTRIVVECSDFMGPKNAPKPAWKLRKQAYLAALRAASAEALLVSIADKIHNARAIERDVRELGPKAWKKFNAPPAEIAWYYRELLAIYRLHSLESISVALADFKGLVAAIDRLARKT